MNSRLLFIVLGVLAAGKMSAQKLGSPVYLYPLVTAAEAGSDKTAGLVGRFVGQAELVAAHRTADTVFLASPKDATTHLEHNVVTGDFRFRKNMTRYLGDFAPRLPSAEEAPRIGLEFLKANHLLPRDSAELKLAHVGGLRAQSVVGGKYAGPIVDKLVTLTYSRLIDGIPVMGPGSKFVLDLGDGGEVIGLTRQWREIDRSAAKRIASEELYSESEAEELARRQILSEFGEKSLIEVRGRGLAYFDNNGSLLQPVYVLETQVITINDGAVPTNYLCVVPLMRSSPEPIRLTALDPKAKELIRTVTPTTRPPVSATQGD